MAVPNYYFPYVSPPPPAVKPPTHPAPPPPSAKPPTHPAPPPQAAKPPTHPAPPPSSAKPPTHPAPPPPSAKPPSHSTPPSPSAKPPSHSTPPPPPHKPFSPPPPYVHPPPALPPHAGPQPPRPLPPSPSPNHHTVIIIVFISCGSVFFLAFLAVALCSFLKKKKKKSAIQETEVIHFDEHRQIKEAIVEGRHGPEAEVLSVEDDVHIDKAIRKDEKSEKRWPYHHPSSSKVQETDIIHVDEHEKVKEDIVEGPHGSKAVLLTIDEDIHVDEEIRKNEKSGKDGHHHLHQAGQ